VHLFYAGALLSVLAYPAAVVGAWPVFATITVAAFVAASAGVGWAARNLGVAQPLAVIPGLLFATTPYLVSDLYGRGAWTELVALAGLSVALGAATSLLAEPSRPRGARVVALALSTAIVAGTHNLTLMFGGGIALLLVLALAGPLGVTSRAAWRRLAACSLASLAGLALCGAFLVPNLWLSPRTLISNEGISEAFLKVAHGSPRGRA
jgi:uncharacterized membrane protein